MKSPMKFAMAASLGLALAVVPASGIAALQQGAKAPDFTLKAAQGGKPFTLSLKQTLRNGPVVLYFFPAAFTPGCTVEAHLFAEASDDFNRQGARVIGVTAGNIDRVAEFSKSECRDKFAVGSDPQARTIKAYDAGALLPGMASRISYVVGQNGKIVFTHEGSNPLKHVEATLQAVQKLKSGGASTVTH